MSDGGYDIDEQIKKKRSRATIRSPVFIKRTGNLVSYPDIPDGEEISKFKEDSDLISKPKISGDLISEEENEKIIVNIKNIESYPSLSDDERDIPEKNLKKKESIEKCCNCSLKEKCKLEAQGSLDLCKRE